MKIIIVGGGISGLYTALKYTDQGHTDIHIYEARNRLGGNIYTTTHQGYQMEAGAGRFNKHHTRLIALLKRFDLHLVKNNPYKVFHPDPSFDLNKAIRTVLKAGSKKSKEELLHITFAQLCDQVLGIEHSKRTMEAFGYNAEFQLTNAYVSLNIFKQDFKPNTTYYSCKEGLSTLIQRMEQHLRSKGVTFHLTQLLLDFSITPKKHFMLRFLDGSKATSHKLILAVPTTILQKMPYFKNKTAILKSVQPVPLHRIYAKTKTPLPQQRTTTDLHLRQYIPLGSDFAMVSYSDSYDAMYWQNYSLQGVSVLMPMLTQELKMVFPQFPEFDWVMSYYWPEGVHAWMPGNDPAIVQSQLKQIHPHLHIVSESFSVRQGWMEGALEIVDDTIRVTKGGQEQYVYLQVPGESKKRKIDVSKWMYQHPGGQEPYTQNMYQDITAKFKNIQSHFDGHGNLKAYVKEVIDKYTVA